MIFIKHRVSTLNNRGKMEADDIPQRSSGTKVDEGNSRFAQAGLSHRLHQETEGDAALHVKIR